METVFYTFCAYLPIHLLAYLPFLDILRFGNRWMALTVARNMAIHMLGVAWVISMGVAAFLSARLFHASARSLECGLSVCPCSFWPGGLRPHGTGQEIFSTLMDRSTERTAPFAPVSAAS